MSLGKILNFSAGPSKLPEDVSVPSTAYTDFFFETRNENPNNFFLFVGSVASSKRTFGLSKFGHQCPRNESPLSDFHVDR